MLALLLPLLGPILDKLVGLIPDPAAQEKAKAAALEQLVAVLSAADDAQMKVNAVEAASPSIFIAGGRPAVIWICAAALAWVALLQPILTFSAAMFGYNPALPAIDGTWITTLLMPLLGLSGMRTIEKMNGVQTNAIGPGGAAPRALMRWDAGDQRRGAGG